MALPKMKLETITILCQSFYNTYKGNLEYKPAFIDVTLSVRRIRPSFLYTDIATSRKMKTKKNGVA